MWEDPIVADVHRSREKLAQQYNYDVEAMFADMQKRQVSLGSRLVLQKARAEPSRDDHKGCDSGSPAAAPAV